MLSTWAAKFNLPFSPTEIHLCHFRKVLYKLFQITNALPNSIKFGNPCPHEM